jgi:hypothetical protein
MVCTDLPQERLSKNQKKVAYRVADKVNRTIRGADRGPNALGTVITNFRTGRPSAVQVVISNAYMDIGWDEAQWSENGKKFTLKR